VSEDDTPARVPEEIQAREYAFPYHHIPLWDGEHFAQHRHWSWGFRYLGGLEMASRLLSRISFESLLDVGCGDGRFLLELHRRAVRARLLGIDRDERAIRLAAALNPEGDYRVLDLLKTPLEERFDAATLIEVIEHIEPAELPRFVEAVAGAIRPGGHVVVTVPHRNKPLNPKHHQHFGGADLRAVLEPHFTDVQPIPFDFSSRPFEILVRLLGGSGERFIVTHRALNRAFYRLYLRRYLTGGDESRCLRIACIARRP